MNILEVQDLCKTYGKGEAAVQALRHATFTVRKGEFIAIIGESGSGKSTFAKLLIHYYDPQKGSISIGGQSHFRQGLDRRSGYFLNAGEKTDRVPAATHRFYLSVI